MFNLVILDDIKFPVTFQCSVYVRECYIRLFDVFLTRLPLMNLGGTAIRFTGTPGVGKSYFLLYMLNELLRRKKSVFVTKDDCTFLFKVEGDSFVVETDPDALFIAERDRDIIHLCDPLQGMAFGKWFKYTVLFVSPSKKWLGSYSSTEVDNFIVPPWDEPEVKQCCDALYGGYSEVHEKRFKLWGGCLWAILYENLQEVYAKQLQLFLNSPVLLHRVKHPCSFEDFQWLLFRWPNNHYREEHFDFPSSYVKKRVGEAIRALEPDIMIKDMTDSTLLGSIYEYFVRKSYLAVGQSIKIGDEDIVITGHTYFTSQKIFDSVTPGTLYIPMEPNKKSVNFACPPFLFQCTIATTPKRSDVEKFISQFPHVTEWKMCFIVPKQRKSVEHKVVQPMASVTNLVFDFNSVNV